MLKTSEYNFIWDLSEDRSLIYNSFTGSVIDIARKDVFILENDEGLRLYQASSEKDKIIESLRDEGFLIDDFVDEKTVLNYRNGITKHKKEFMNLTIIPTYKCNLNCFYCYQDRQQASYMSSELQEDMIQFVRHQLKDVKKMHVTWFGGEPLMAWDLITNMSKQFIEMCDAAACEYSANIVTNGFLFDQEKMDALGALKISRVQITLDGPPAENAKRKRIPGDPLESFEKILGIIEALLNRKVDLNVRINIDKNNKESLDELMTLIEHRPARGANWYPARISPYTTVCKSVENSCFDVEDFSRVEHEFYAQSFKKGLRSEFGGLLPKNKSMFCAANHVNSYIVDPVGDLYKCWNEVGDVTKRMACLDKDGKTVADSSMKMQQMKWISCNPLEFDACNKCKLLPVCMGGCPHGYIDSGKSEPECQTLKTNIETIVKNHYYWTKANQLLGNNSLD